MQKIVISEPQASMTATKYNYVLLSCEISYLFKKSLGWVDVDTKISSLNIHIFFYVGVFPGAQRFGRGCIPFQGNLLLLFHA